jgi:hypothetical protein
VFTAPLDRNRLGTDHRKHCSSVVCVRFCGNVFTEPLPSIEVFRLSGIMSQYNQNTRQVLCMTNELRAIKVKLFKWWINAGNNGIPRTLGNHFPSGVADKKWSIYYINIIRKKNLEAEFIGLQKLKNLCQAKFLNAVRKDQYCRMELNIFTMYYYYYYYYY